MAINGTSGNDTVRVSGTSATLNGATSTYDFGAATLGAGNDSITMSNTTLSSNLNAGDGNDYVSLAMVTSINNISLGDGADTLIATSISVTSIHANSSTVGGSDSIQLTSSTVTGHLYANQATSAEGITLTSSSVGGTVYTGGGADTIVATNSSINGSINAGDGGDYVSLNNVAQLDSILLAGGNDTLIANSVSVSGDVWGSDYGNSTIASSELITITNSTISGGIFDADGAGASSLYVSATSVGGAIATSSLADTVSISGSTVNGSLDLGAGADAVTLATVTSIDAISLGDGADTLVATSISVSGNVLGDGTVATVGGADLFSITNSTLYSTVSTGAGNDSITLSTVVSLNAISLGDGSDSLIVSNVSISGNVEGDTTVTSLAGNDVISLTSATVSGALSAGAGADSLALSGASVAALSLGDGTDRATISNSILTNIYGGASSLDGGDWISLGASTVTGSIQDTLGGGTGTTLMLTGSSVNGAIETSSVADVVTLTSSTVNGAIDLGAGNDSINVQNVVSIDAISLGDGADTISGSGINVSGNVVGDSSAAGAGADVISLSSSTIAGGILDSLGASGASISLQGGGDVVVLSGVTSIDNIYLDDGNDTLVPNAISVSGQVWGGVAGNTTADSWDVFSITNSTIGGDLRDSVGIGGSSIYMGSTSIGGFISSSTLSDTIQINNSTLNGYLLTSTGDDSVTLNVVTSIDGVSLGDGNDSLVMTGSSVSGNIVDDSGSVFHMTIQNSTVDGVINTGGAGSGTVSISGVQSLDGIYLSSSAGSTVGSSVDAIIENTSVSGSLLTGAAGGDLTLSAVTVGGFQASAGNQFISVSNSSLSGDFDNTDSTLQDRFEITLNNSTVGDGTNAIINRGEAFSLSASHASLKGGISRVGTDYTVGDTVQLLNGTTLTGNYAGSSLGDSVVLSNSSAGNLSLGAGNDILRIDSTSTVGAAYGEGGIDTLALSGNWTLTLTSAATLNGGGTVTTVSNLTYKNVAAYSGGLVTGTVSLGSGDTLAVNTFESVVCFAAGTQIATPQGPRAVEMLQPGDLVETADGGPQPLRWVGRRDLGGGDLVVRPNQRPIRIRAGALGRGLPTRDLIVSPQHRILLAGPEVERHLGLPEVLVAAKHLQPLPGVEDWADCTAVTYVHLLLDRHHVLFANDAPAESMFTGRQAMRALHPEARAEILALMPALHEGRGQQALARPVLEGKQGRHLAQALAQELRHSAPISSGATGLAAR